MSNRVIGIAGWKNSGKTTLTERLVAELVGRGWRISTVKRAHHDADVDHEGTDSFRHRRAGASEVLLTTGKRWALMHELRGEDEPPLEALLARLSPCDLVVVEGFKTGDHPKIEVRRTEAGDHTPLPASANVVAIAADHAVADAGVPVFSLDAVPAIADFVETAMGMR
ncbi:MAG: molybdopterin-guanine dinucleotide biosynthesis protein B [Aquamicrobium sp.]|nr:molybdopterin-guanine dinucleotide biosynthesis protein B [Aquamicrobium sp.]